MVADRQCADGENAGHQEECNQRLGEHYITPRSRPRRTERPGCNKEGLAFERNVGPDTLDHVALLIPPKDTRVAVVNKRLIRSAGYLYEQGVVKICVRSKRSMGQVSSLLSFDNLLGCH